MVQHKVHMVEKIKTFFILEQITDRKKALSNPEILKISKLSKFKA